MMSRARKKNSVDPPKPNPFNSDSEALNPRPARATSVPPDYENQSVNVLEQYTVNKSKETTDNLNDCLKIAEAIKEDSTRTLVMLHQQGEQTHRTHQQADDMDHDLSRSEKLLNSLEGLFSKPWKPKKTQEIKGPEKTINDPLKKKVNHTESSNAMETVQEDRTTTEVMHECKRCPSSFLAGQALGGHMRSHAPKRKSVQNEDLLGKCLNEIKKAANCLMLLYRRKKPKLGDGKDDTKVKSFEKGTTPKKSTVKSLNAQSEYECSICHKTFSSFQALGGHKASHGKERRDSLKRIGSK